MNSVCKDFYSALCCEMKWTNLTITILDFGVRLYGGSELSKYLSKCLPRMRKTQKLALDPNFLWWTKISEVMCTHDWHNVRSYLFFNVRTFWTKISDSVCNDLFTKNITFFVVVEKQKSKAAQITKSNVMHYFPKSNWVMHLHFCISISTKTLLCVITSGEKQCRHWARINFIFQPEAYSFHFWYEKIFTVAKNIYF